MNVGSKSGEGFSSARRMSAYAGYPPRMQTAQVIGHHAMAGPAQRGEIARLFVAEVFVCAMMHLECAVFPVAIAQAAAEAGGLEFGKARRVLTPTATRDVFVVVHDQFFCSSLELCRRTWSGSQQIAGIIPAKSIAWLTTN